MAPLSAHASQEQAPPWVNAVLEFWFEELRPESWFKRDDVVDHQIRDRFGEIHSRLLREGLAPTSAHEALAAVIVLDQFSRNMFRGTARAFASDAKAHALAMTALTAGWDRELDTHCRLFLYLPFEHSENIEDQRRSVALICALGDPRLTEYAVAQERIIERFGRFPHRNTALGRTSTAAEQSFLNEPGSSF